MLWSRCFEVGVPVKALRASLSFYQKMGFRRAEDPTRRPGISLRDGGLRLHLEARGTSPATLIFMVEDLGAAAQTLEDLGIEAQRHRAVGGSLERLSFTDPEGHEVRLESLRSGESIDESTLSSALFGTFGEVSLEVEDLKAARYFWRSLGFIPSPYSPGGSADWESLSNDRMLLGLYTRGHCKHVFKSPALAYFNADAQERALQLRQVGAEIVDELEGGQVVVETPEGLHFFLFGA